MDVVLFHQTKQLFCSSCCFSFLLRPSVIVYRAVMTVLLLQTWLDKLEVTTDYSAVCELSGWKLFGVRGSCPSGQECCCCATGLCVTVVSAKVIGMLMTLRC